MASNFSKLVNIQAVDKIRQPEIPTDTPVVPEPSFDKTGIAAIKLKFNKFPGTDIILTDISCGQNYTGFGELINLVQVERIYY
jgi:hypothetical protein